MAQGAYSIRDINTVYILLQYVTFYARGKQRTVSKSIVQLRRGEIAPGDSDVYANLPLLVPPLPPSQLIHCNIIDIKYKLIVSK